MPPNGPRIPNRGARMRNAALLLGIYDREPLTRQAREFPKRERRQKWYNASPPAVSCPRPYLTMRRLRYGC